MRIIRLIVAVFLVQLCLATSDQNIARGPGDVHVLIKNDFVDLDDGNKTTEGKVFSEIEGKEIEHLARDDNKGQNVDASYSYGNPHKHSSPAASVVDGPDGARYINLTSTADIPDRKDAPENHGRNMNESSPSETEHLKDEMLTASYFNRDVDIAPGNATLPPSPDPMDIQGSVTTAHTGKNKEKYFWLIVVVVVLFVFAIIIFLDDIYMDGQGFPCCRPRRDPEVPDIVQLIRMRAVIEETMI